MSIRPHPLLVKSYYKLISYDKIRFIVVGGTGFMVNFLFLTLLYHLLKLPIVISQIVSAEAALLATFLGNNFWAFAHHKPISMKHKLAKFHVSAIAGIIINSTILVILVRYAHIFYGLALIAGSIAGLLWNYTLYSRYVFKTHKSKAELEDFLVD